MSSCEFSFFYRYCIVYNSINEPFINYFKEKLKENKFDFKEFTKDDKNILILGQTDENLMLKVAEQIKIRKVYTKHNPVTSNDIVLPDKVIENEKKRTFIHQEKNDFTSDDYYDRLYKIKKNDDENWGLGLFTETEMLTIEYKILTDIKVEESSLMKILDTSKLAKKREKIQKFIKNDVSLLNILIQFKVIEEHFPLHVSDIKENLLKEAIFSRKFPYRDIRSYFGDKVAMYYAWMYHYTRLLIFPSIFSFLTILLSYWIPHSSKILITLYAVLVAIWTQIFTIYWNRKCSEIAIEWDNYTEEYDRDNIRREFKGEWRKSLITEQYEKTYSNLKRKFSYLKSIIISIPFILIALLINIFFLNISGFIKPNVKSIFEIQLLGNLTAPGEIFDVNGYLQILIGIIHVIVIEKFNHFYRKVAHKTCDYENHKNKSNYENSLIIKRFVFEFFDTFFPAFYLSFIVNDLQAVKQLIKSHFIVSEIRRVLTETLLPNLIAWIKGSVNILFIYKL